MINRRQLRSRPAPWMRVLAALGIGLVVLLAVGAQCPELHAWLHGKEAGCVETQGASAAQHQNADAGSGQTDADYDDDGCAITLFAHGVVVAAVILAALAQLARLRVSHAVAQDWIAPAGSPYRLPLAQAPPRG